MKKGICYAVALCVLGMFACKNAEGDHDHDETTMQTEKSNSNSAERYDSKPYYPNQDEVMDFVYASLSNGRMEVLISDLALNRSMNEEIDQLARTIKEDHQKANDGLVNIIDKNDWALPDTLMNKQQRNIDKLRKTDGQDFNEQYLDMVISTHKDAIAELERCQQKAYDPMVMGWINKYLPVLRQDLDRTETLQNRVVSAN